MLSLERQRLRMKLNCQLRHNLPLIGATVSTMIKCWKMMAINGLAMFHIAVFVVMRL